VKSRLNTAVVCAISGLSLLIAACGGGTPASQPNGPSITSITVTPIPATVLIGTQLQFTATVTGTGSYSSAVTWRLSGPLGSSLSAGTLSATGLYITPSPAPATVTVVATSNQDPTKSSSVTVTLAKPPTVTGPALTVDAGNRIHAINPLIYGMNNYLLEVPTALATSLPVDRWGGTPGTSYNYELDVTNAGSDWYFENIPGTTSGYPDVSEFNTEVLQDESTGTKTMGTVPMAGWITLRNGACSFSVAKYGAQKTTDPGRPDCGNGVLKNGNNVLNDPTDTAMPIDKTFVSGWVSYLADRFGNAASGGIAIYDLDNEPEWWDYVHKDVHPSPLTYDELVGDSLTYSKAVKDSDPTAEVSGPVISLWMDFFYSKKDIETGWATSPCFCANGNPVDRLAHGDVPLIEYYLQHFKNYEDSNGIRLLDYLDLHTYFAPDNLGLTSAGDTLNQKTRLDSTRALWDSSYTQPIYTDPDDRTSAAKPYPTEIIPRMRGWVANNYPGTKLAISEYAWGGLEAMNGALTQADILGIFGREGLDLGALWRPPDPTTQIPGMMAFEVYRNYDGAKSTFGDMALESTSGDQGKLSVYGALRTADSTVTIVVINKTYGDLTETLSLANLTPNGAAKAYLYSNAHPAGIVAQPNLTVMPPTGGGTTSTLSTIFPAQSITVLVVPKL